MTRLNLIQTVYTAIQRHDLIVSNRMVVVGVSGGTDSLALLDLLAELSERLDIHLHVATLDHGLRGDAGAADVNFVAATASDRNIPVTTGFADVRALAQERRLGIEAAARIARYDFLASVARQVGADRVAVAHNANDQVETVLLHLLRGSSLSGLAGMAYAAPLPGHPELTLIRPLLDVSRADLEAYCLVRNLQPRHDASNDDLSYMRNRLRRETIPYLRELSPQIERRLLQLAEIAALEDDFADSALHAAVDPHVVRSEGRLILPRVVFVAIHPALQRRFVVWAVRSLGDASEPDYQHITAAVELALRGQVGARAQFKSGVQLRNDYGQIIVERQAVSISDKPPVLPPDAVIPIAIPCVTAINANWSLEASLTPLEGEVARLAVPEGSEIMLRGRRKGDRFLAISLYGHPSLGLAGHTKKIAEWMIDHKVPRNLRERLPLVVVNGEIAAVLWLDWTVGERFRVAADSPRVVYFRLNKDFHLD